MPKFLNTSATNYLLEELIKDARDRLILISPYLKLNDRIKELLTDKNRLKIDVRIIYGKNELQPEEINWLRELSFVRTSFCKNLHAKCYMNENACIITSLNLYEFSQVNNNEMGVYLARNEDLDAYKDAYDEAQRIIRVSEEIRISLEKVPKESDVDPSANSSSDKTSLGKKEKISSSRLAAAYKKKTPELLERMVELGYLLHSGKGYHLTQLGIEAGGELVPRSRFGAYFLWPVDIKLT